MAILSNRDQAAHDHPTQPNSEHLANLRAFLAADPVEFAARANANPRFGDPDWEGYTDASGRWVQRVYPLTAEDVAKSQVIVADILAAFAGLAGEAAA